MCLTVFPTVFEVCIYEATYNTVYHSTICLLHTESIVISDHHCVKCVSFSGIQLQIKIVTCGKVV